MSRIRLRGIFVLGLPFALVRSGYVGLVLLVVSAWVCNHTGRILVACLYEEEQSLSVMLYCLSRASSWSWSSLCLSVDPEEFLVSVGVIIFSYTSQIFLPPLEGSMEDRGQFDAMLGWTHGAACVMKTVFSLLAVLTWGAETREVITDNLPSDLRPLVNLCLLAKALLSYPLPFYSAAEILQTCLLGDAVVSSKHGGRGVSRPALLVRAALLMTSYLLALLVPRFSLLMGLTGSVTGAAMTLILPCLFHLRLQWGRITARERLIDVCILSLGVICSVSGVICSVKRLVEGL
ncbi:Vesicular inhibitory amino acid transporter GABA [Larimichthys crocea]|uniref:Vesicular inhibitory amino acid transporter n=1 Tax=Larimichthys crocea TaxID=215358 RepID=A0A6G0I5Y4_LARCR|nr:Vesicular inhibitory amino acid transporter GABA [Larimichthys crocea]